MARIRSTLRIFEPLFWSLLVGFLDNVLLQRDHAAAHVGSCVPTELGNGLFRFDVCEHRDVV